LIKSGASPGQTHFLNTDVWLNVNEETDTLKLSVRKKGISRQLAGPSDEEPDFLPANNANDRE
jgi:hypothetical protein